MREICMVGANYIDYIAADRMQGQSSPRTNHGKANQKEVGRRRCVREQERVVVVAVEIETEENANIVGEREET